MSAGSSTPHGGTFSPTFGTSSAGQDVQTPDAGQEGVEPSSITDFPRLTHGRSCQFLTMSEVEQTDPASKSCIANSRKGPIFDPRKVNANTKGDHALSIEDALRLRAHLTLGS
jgi:hypothetical protein